MTVALVLDFPGGTRQQYDEVMKLMHLNGQMPPGGLVHCAGPHEGGWRVVDVWEDMAHFERFRDEQIAPHTRSVGIGPPEVRVVEVDQTRDGSGAATAFVQVVTLPGLDHDSFHAGDDTILPGGEIPAALTFHVNGPVQEGWCVIDGWMSKEERDAFLESHVRPAMADAPLQGPPRIEDLIVQATMSAGATAPA